MKEDWFTNPKTKETVTFVDFARSEGRFSKHFDREGHPSETLVRAGRPPGELARPPGTRRPEVTRSMTAPLAVHEYRQGGMEAALEFLKRTRAELRLLRMVRLGQDFVRVYDVNGDSFEIRGLGYADPGSHPAARGRQRRL